MEQWNGSSEPVQMTDADRMSQRKKPRLRDDASDGGRSLASMSTAYSLRQGIGGAHHLGALIAPEAFGSPKDRSVNQGQLLEESALGLHSLGQKNLDKWCEDGCMETRNRSEEVWRKELIEFSFPFVIADPSFPTCPVILCSQGFNQISSCSDEVLGRGLKSLGEAGSLSKEVAAAVDALICSAHAGNFMPEGVCCLAGSDRMTAGELLFATSSGMAILKQVMLDDDMFIIGVLDKDRGDCDLIRRLTAWLDAAVTTLAAEFFYSAPLCRQVADGIDYPDMTQR